MFKYCICVVLAFANNLALDATLVAQFLILQTSFEPKFIFIQIMQVNENTKTFYFKLSSFVFWRNKDSHTGLERHEKIMPDCSIMHKLSLNLSGLQIVKWHFRHQTYQAGCVFPMVYASANQLPLRWMTILTDCFLLILLMLEPVIHF